MSFQMTTNHAHSPQDIEHYSTTVLPTYVTNF